MKYEESGLHNDAFKMTFNEVSLHAHVEDGAERTKGSIHRVMFRLMTGVSYTSNAVPRPPQLPAVSNRNSKLRVS